MSGPARASADGLDAGPEAIPSPLPAAGADLLTRSGSTVHVRPVLPDDHARLTDFYRGLSDRARTLRFCAPVNDDYLTKAAGRFAAMEGNDGVGLVATERDGRRVMWAWIRTAGAGVWRYRIFPRSGVGPSGGDPEG